MLHWSKVSQGIFSTLPTVLHKSRARAHTRVRARSRADTHAPMVQEYKVIFATCSTNPRKKRLARAQEFSTPQPQIDSPPFTHT